METSKIDKNFIASEIDADGDRVRFSTSSPFVVISAKLHKHYPLVHMPLAGTAGFDLYVDGETFFCAPYRESCTVDGIHPNDLGFALMADLIEKTLTQAFSNSKLFGY